MRHRKHHAKLGRKKEHRLSLLRNLTAELIKHKRIKTTLAKAKALRPFAEKLVTLAKTDTLHRRRLVLARLAQKEGVVRDLFKDIAPRFKERPGGYTRITKLGPRLTATDAANMALIEWVGFELTPKEDEVEESKEKKSSKKKEEKPSSDKDTSVTEKKKPKKVEKKEKTEAETLEVIDPELKTPPSKLKEKK